MIIRPLRDCFKTRQRPDILLCMLVGLLLAGCAAQVRVAEPVYVAPAVVRVDLAPPALPVYDQPPCPVIGYIWTPGYWAWATAGYYWVPGTWVAPSRFGVLWTPGYWGFVGGAYIWHAGYWGPHVGFYGGVNYGFGYVGSGYYGGRWVGNSFAYNQSVTNVNVTNIRNVNVYNETVVNNVTVNRVSYNGGSGGTVATPSAQERMAEHETHIAATPVQQRHVQQAATNSALFARSNGGHPSIAATPRANAFNSPGVIAARSASAPDRPGVEENHNGLNHNEAYRGGNTGHAGNHNPERTQEKPSKTKSRSAPNHKRQEAGHQQSEEEMR